MTATVDVAAAHLPLPRLHARGRSTILSLCGECDLATRGQLQVEFTQALAGGVEHLLILDLSRLDFCDLGSARLIYEASHADRVVVTGMSASMSKMFDMLDPDLTLSRAAARTTTLTRPPMAVVSARRPRRSAPPQTPMELVSRAPAKSATPPLM